ncbi:hypothetical protein RclHR1_04620007 [Rhizophagus clarus]|uniref:RING-type E3 ubiquitin transferase n=1 Tax=Rhizophagus clarus TaxID=94130 RepID=A0A2Z6RZX0_9GLOM|nr:hypothetical protein RclHR1_04620007 [Rhizophagus clarus]GES95259.1 C2H2 finger domain protein [Rhizophagus clarus]
MSTTSNSTDIQTTSGTGPEQSNRENRRYYNNNRRQRGGRPYFNRSNRREHNSSSNQNSRSSATTRRTFSNSNENSNLNGKSQSNGNSNLNENVDLNGNESPTPISTSDVCFICAEPVTYYAVSECNHKFCHLCSLRIRALYENKNCAYCKTEQEKVIFTRKHDKEFQEFKESDIPYFDENLNAYCEDQEMLDDIRLLLEHNCPYSNCDVSCEGWSELKRHVKFTHKLMLCDICIRHKKIFSHEHSLFNNFKELDKHFREGDEDSGFKGHPECQFCKRRYYGDDELYEHCRDKHEQCFICVRAGIRHGYYRDYNSLEEHFNLDHYLCQDKGCLEKKFVVFESDIDLRAHEVDVHGTNLSGQRAKHEARRIGMLYNDSYADSHSRRRRSRERQPERRADGDDVIQTVVEEISSQTQNLNLDSTTSVANGMIVNARTIRPPPGFGVLSPDEVIVSANESPESEVQLRNMAYTPPRMREEDFPTLSDAMGVSTSNNSGTIKNYSERVKQNPKPADRPKPVDKHKPADKPKPTADKPTQSVASSSRSETPLYSLQQPMFESTKKKNTSAFPPLPSTNQSTSTLSSSSSSTSTLNYREKALSSSSFENSSNGRKLILYQRIFGLLSNNSTKMDEFSTLTDVYSDSSILGANSYIESLLKMFKKNDDVGKVVNGLVEILEDENKKQELLRAWNDHKVKRNTSDFPALEPVYSPTSSNSRPSITTPPLSKPSPRVLVIKSSTARSGGTKSSSGPRVWDKIAAIAESKKTNGKNNSNFPSLATSASTSSNNDIWKNSAPKFVQSSSRSESASSSANNSSSTTSTSYTTAFVRGRPTKAEIEEFPVLPLTSKSTSSQQRIKKNGSENNAWGQGGSFTSVTSDNNSEEDSSYSESTKDGSKKKKQKKQKGKNVIFHVG